MIHSKFKKAFDRLRIALDRKSFGKRTLSGGSKLRLSAHYYRQVADCQVAGLGFLLSLFLGERQDGWFVEVGAFDGISFSNTYGLAERGWRGLLVEPIKSYADRCRNVHSGHEAVSVVNVAVGNVDNSVLQLSLAGPLTSGDADTIEEYNNVSWAQRDLSADRAQVALMRLDTLLRSHDVPVGFDVLVVDVEGFENQVFEGFDLDTWRPGLMIWELSDTHPDLSAHRKEHFELQRCILRAGYSIVYKDGINTVFVRQDLVDAVYIGDRIERRRTELV